MTLNSVFGVDIIYTHNEINEFLKKFYKRFTDLGFNIYEIHNFLEDYQIDFYKKNETLIKKINIVDKNDMLLFYPFHRVTTILTIKLMVVMYLSEEITKAENINITQLIQLISFLENMDLKHIEKTLISNEEKYILNKVNNSLKYINENEKVDLLNAHIYLFQNIIQEQINLNHKIEHKYELSQLIYILKDEVTKRDLLDNYFKVIENISIQGLTNVITKLERQREKIKKANPKEILTSSNLNSETIMNIKQRLEEIGTHRQLVNVVLLAFYRALGLEIKNFKSKNKQINKRSLIKDLLNFFFYSGDILNIQKSVQNFDINLINLGSIVKNEDKQLCSDLESYISLNNQIFLNMIKFREKSMANL